MPDIRDLLPQPPWKGPPVPEVARRGLVSPECARKPLWLISVAYRAVDGADFYLIEDNVSGALQHLDVAKRYVITVGKPELCFEIDKAIDLINKGDYHEAYHAMESAMNNITRAAFEDVVRCECRR